MTYSSETSSTWPKQKWPVSVNAVIPISTPEFWRLIEEPGHFEKFHPFVAKHSAIQWPGDNAHDVVEYYGGGVYERRFIEWSEHCLRIEACEKEERLVFVEWHIYPKSSTETDLTIYMKPLTLKKYPKLLRYLAYRVYIYSMLKNYTNHVMKGLIYYIETGKTVERNQFGAMNYFSPKVTCTSWRR